MFRKSRLRRSGKGRRKERLAKPYEHFGIISPADVDSDDIGEQAQKGGISGMFHGGLEELQKVGSGIPKKAEKVTGGKFMHEFIHLEKKPEPLSMEDVSRIQSMLQAGASWEDLAREYGYRKETLKQLIEDAEIESGVVRGFFA